MIRHAILALATLGIIAMTTQAEFIIDLSNAIHFRALAASHRRHVGKPGGGGELERSLSSHRSLLHRHEPGGGVGPVTQKHEQVEAETKTLSSEMIIGEVLAIHVNLLVGNEPCHEIKTCHEMNRHFTK